jgi:hypothetical protein
LADSQPDLDPTPTSTPTSTPIPNRSRQAEWPCTCTCRAVVDDPFPWLTGWSWSRWSMKQACAVSRTAHPCPAQGVDYATWSNAVSRRAGRCRRGKAAADKRRAAAGSAEVSGRDRHRSGDLTLFRRALYQLSYPTNVRGTNPAAVLTGFEPATSGLTGRRALQTAPQDPVSDPVRCTPNGIRTRVTALKGRRPRPLDDGGSTDSGPRQVSRGAVRPHWAWALSSSVHDDPSGASRTSTPNAASRSRTASASEKRRSRRAVSRRARASST